MFVIKGRAILTKRLFSLLLATLIMFLFVWGALSNFSKLQVIELTSLGKGYAPIFLDNSRILFSNDGLQLRNLHEDTTNNLGELEDTTGGYDWLNTNELLYRKYTDPAEEYENGIQFGLFNLETGDTHPLPIKKFPGAPWSPGDFSISPNQSKIAFSSHITSATGTETGKSLIHIMDMETMEILVIDTLNEKYCREPDWSPDGTKIIYTCRASDISIRDPISEHVWSTDLNTNKSELLMKNLTDYRHFSWAPNNEWVAFTHNFSVWLAPVKNGIPDLKAKYHLRFRDEINIDMWDPDFYFSPPGKVSWSPNSKYITFAGSLHDEHELKYEVWIAELE